MKPIKLIINAYGSYGGRAEVDFTRYDAEGLFIITGDTGAGKTTIFDAMCYGLYGEASGAFRGNKTFRSNFADDGAETYVNFTFQQGGKEYRIVRKPEYYFRRLVKKTGEYREQRHPASVELYKPDGEILTKERQINGSRTAPGAIENILGMTFEQFKQISMIAQGEFQQVLNASSDKRLEIFRKLFDTDKYQEFSYKLKERSSAARKEYGDIKQSIINLIGQLREGKAAAEGAAESQDSVSAPDPKSFGKADEPKLLTELEILQSLDAAVASENIIDEAAMAVEHIKVADAAQLDTLQKQAATADSDYDNALGEVREAERDNQAIDNYNLQEQLVQKLDSQLPKWQSEKQRLNRGKQALYKVKPVCDAAEKAAHDKKEAAIALQKEQNNQAEADKAYADAIEAQKQADAHKSDVEALRIEMAELAKKEPEYEKADKLAKAIKAADKKVKRLEAEYREYADKAAGLKKAIAADEEQVKQLPEAQKSYEQADFRYASLGVIYQAINDKQNKVNNAYKAIASDVLEGAEGAYNAAKDAYDSSLKKYCAAKGKYDRAVTALELNRAGILADYLRENPEVPCPVCGSTHHPRLAEHMASDVTEVSVNKLKQAYEKADNAKNNAYNELSLARQGVLTVLKGISNAYDGLRNVVEERYDSELADKELLATIPEPVLSLPIAELQAAYKDSILLIKNITSEVDANSTDGSTVDTIDADRAALANSAGAVNSAGSSISAEHSEVEYHNETQQLMDSGKRVLEGFAKQREIIAVYGTQARAVRDAAMANRDSLNELQERLVGKRTAYEDAQSKEKAKAEKLNEAKQLVSALKGQQQAMEKLRFGSLKEAQAYRRQQERIAAGYQKAIDAAIVAVKKTSEDTAAAKARVEELGLQLTKCIGEEQNAMDALTFKLAENGFADIKDYKNCLMGERDIVKLEKDIRRYEDSLRDHKTQLAEAKKQLKLNAEGNVILGKADVQKLAAKANRLKTFAEGIKELQREINARTKNNAELMEKLKVKKPILISVGSKAGRLEELYKYISGQSTGKVKLSLEAYVQAAGFDRIIAAANQRLNMISGGQYRLVRHDDTGDEAQKSKGKGDKRSNHALDLDVHDSYTGATRPVGTLSGGESFKASLSLALGLSDTVARDNAGISVDSIFIDEGFGTLDGQSLTDTVNMLTTLASKNKLVGIISHNEELARSIPQKLAVYKDGAKGSILVQK